MLIYFLTLVYPIEEQQGNIYTNLMQELVSRGHKVVVFTADETGKYERHINKGNINIENIRTGKITKSNYVLKAINTLLLSRRYKNRIQRVLKKDIHLDLLIYSTPPITFTGAVSYLKEYTGCHTYLLLKDIFPANAIDLGIIKPRSLIWYYFRRKEKKLYNISDRIGCMSKANVNYLLKNNPSIKNSKVEICYNSIYPTPIEKIRVVSQEVLEKYKIPLKPFTMIYGGSIGEPQGVQFIIDVINSMRYDNAVQFIIVGDGTKFKLLSEYRDKSCNESLFLIKTIPRTDYLSMLSYMDAGLIFLDERFTIPNFPSRVLDYFNYSLPILAATDTTTDLKDLIECNKCGLWSKAGDVESFKKNVEKLMKNPLERKSMGKRGRKYLENNLSVTKSADVILAPFK